MKKRVRPSQFGAAENVITPLAYSDLAPLPGEDMSQKEFKKVRADLQEKYDYSLDGFSALNLPMPKTPEEEAQIVNR